MKDSDFGLNIRTFPKLVQDLVKEKKCNYIDATIMTCEKYNVDPADVKKLLPKAIREKIEADALELNMLKYKKKTVI